MIKNKNNAIVISGLILICAFILSLSLGRYFVAPYDVFKILVSNIFNIKETWTQQASIVVINVRLPRIIMATLIGMGLSVSGCAFQAVFQNPMASPDVLGASAGAGFGAALGLLLGFSYTMVTVNAFIFGITSVILVVLLSGKIRSNPTLGLVLSGMMVSSLASAALSFIKLIADPQNQLPVITYWLMGSLASIKMIDVKFASPFIIIGLLIIYALRWRINVLTAGDEQARTMGVNVKLTRLIIVVSATLITSACVSVSGMIGWIGLVIPHLTRMIIGSDNRYLVPVSALIGGTFLLVVDNISRLATTSEIPIGILTAFIGAPFFIGIIIKEGGKL